MNLATARAAIATALSALSGVEVRTRPWKGAGKAGDGWVTITRIEPADFKASYATFAVVVILSADEVKAETALEDQATGLIDALTGSNLDPTDVVLEPTVMTVGQSASPLYAAVLTITLEVT
jgi:hypothetical protein